ncbi:MAG: hypothetical protein IKM17_04420 [Lentisphaeria bacterium]|nr:hypothetical protein [Lentisphaeria bacterium]
MKKTTLYSLLTIALAALLSACMSQAEKEFRSMSAVSQMEDVKNILFQTVGPEEKKEKWENIAVFGEDPTGFFHMIHVDSSKSGFYDQAFMDFPLFNVMSPIISLSGLEGWDFEKVNGKERTFRLNRRKGNDRLDTIVEIAFDPAGRLLSCQISEQGTSSPLLTMKVTKWVKVNNKEFPAESENSYDWRKARFKYTGWQFNLPADEVQKIIEDKQKQSNNKTVKERSNP